MLLIFTPIALKEALQEGTFAVTAIAGSDPVAKSYFPLTCTPICNTASVCSSFKDGKRLFGILERR